MSNFMQNSNSARAGTRTPVPCSSSNPPWNVSPPVPVVHQGMYSQIQGQMPSCTVDYPPLRPFSPGCIPSHPFVPISMQNTVFPPPPPAMRLPYFSPAPVTHSVVAVPPPIVGVGLAPPCNIRPPSFLHHPPPVIPPQIAQSSLLPHQVFPVGPKLDFWQEQHNGVNHLQENDKKNSNDEDWVHNWLKEKCFKNQKNSKSVEVMVCDAKSTLKEALHALADLRETTRFLKNSINVDESMWCFKQRKAMKAQEKLKLLTSVFTPDVISSLKSHLKKIKKKRDSISVKKMRNRENHLLELQERDLLHGTIDAWRKSIEDEVQTELKKEEVKHEADNILSEVRKKQQEAKKSLDYMNALVKLRSARKENAEKKGLKISSESSNHFEEKVQKLQNLMNNQLKVYEAEEHALKVMLEIEREQEKHHKLQRQLEALKNCQKQITQHLFGKPPDNTSSLHFHHQFYMQSHNSLDSLIQIRQLWDSFLVVPDDPLGSPLPLGWILPSPPSSSDWQVAIASNETD